MIRNLKALGLALVAVFAMSAMIASAASAEKSYRTAEAPATLHGTQILKAPNIFHVPGAGSVECSGAVFTGSQATTAASTVTVTPDYTGCKAFGFATAHIIENGCHYTFGTPTSALTAGVTVFCPGSPITITPTFLGSSVCTITVGSHTPGGNVDFTNNPKVTTKIGEKEEEVVETGKVLVTSTVTNISHSAGCGAEAKADGTYTGGVLVEGNKGAVSVS